MELIVLNEQFQQLGDIDQFSSLQWNRKYYDFGNFELHCPTKYFSLLDSGTYLFRKDSDELAVIESLDYSVNERGRMDFKCSGRFVESLLNDRCFEKEANYTGTQEQIARNIVQKYAIDRSVRSIPNLILGKEAGLGEDTSLQVDKKYVGDKLYELLEEQELSQRIRYDYLTDQLIYEVWQGKDRTDAQQENSWAVFSDDFENIVDSEYSRDTSKLKNYAYVIGKTKDGKNPLIVEIDRTEGDTRRREMYVSASTSWKNDDDSEMTEAQYREKLTQLGNEELDKYKQVEVFDGTIRSQANLKYKVDYDLGDLCTCINAKIGKMADKRITAIKEIYEDGKVEIEPSFGKNFETINQIIRGR